MSVFAANPGKEMKQATSIPNTGDLSSERKTVQRDAFWADALESASMLLWIATHLPNPKQYPFL